MCPKIYLLRSFVNLPAIFISHPTIIRVIVPLSKLSMAVYAARPEIERLVLWLRMEEFLETIVTHSGLLKPPDMLARQDCAS